MSAVQQPNQTLPHWDLSNVFPGMDSKEFANAIADLNLKLNDLDSYLSKSISQASSITMDCESAREIINSYLERTNFLQRLQGTLLAYTRSFVTTDSFNDTAKRLSSELEIIGVRSQQQRIRFQSWLRSVAKDLPQILNVDGVAKEHAYYLTELAAQSLFIMGEPEESLAAELGTSGTNAWSRLQGTVCSQLTVPFEMDGETKQLPMPAIQNLLSHPDAAVRRRAYEADLAGWETVKEPLAAAMNGVKGAAITLFKRRGRSDSLHEALDLGRIDRETLETMLGVMEDSFPLFRGYLKVKARRLGQEALPWWDLFAPVGKLDRNFSWSEARDFIVEQFGKFSPRMAGMAARAFANNWIDAEPRNGKRGNAFCMMVPGVEESRVLVNFDGSLNRVITLAHELGHSYNIECWKGKTMLQRIWPMTLAETGSTFCETLVTDAALAAVSSADEELAILDNSLTHATQIIVDISSRYLFEKEVFERREKAELSADEFCEIMLRQQEATYGEGLDGRYLHKFMWTWKPHYYYPSLSYYNFPYAFGLLFATGLYAIYKEKGSAFVPDYDALLASNGEASAAELAGRFGIDLHKPAFWEDSIKIIAGQVKRYEELG